MALTPAQSPGRMPARRLVWMTGLMFQTRLQENPNPMAFKGRAGGGPLAMPGMRESPRHGRGVSRRSDLPPPRVGASGEITSRRESAISQGSGNAGGHAGARQIPPSAGVPCLPHEASRRSPCPCIPRPS